MQRFELLGRNGAGANSTVFRCRQNPSGGIVAVKKIEGATLPQVLQEAAIMCVCAHKHCVRLLEAHQGVASGVIYLVMEHIEHSLSRELLLNPRGLPLERAKVIIFQLASALDVVHSKKVVHGDLKPANVLLTGQNDVKLCDFGSATSTLLGSGIAGNPITEGTRSVADASRAPPLFPETLQPTPKVTAAASRWYCAPESLLGSAGSAASDIWALGCILAELVTGKPLMPGGGNELDQLCCVVAMVGRLSNGQEQLLQLLPWEQHRKIDEARARGPLLDRIPKVAACPGLAEVLKACLQPEPACRPTAQQLQTMPFFDEIRQTQPAREEEAAAPGTWPGLGTVTSGLAGGPAVKTNEVIVSAATNARSTSWEGGSPRRASSGSLGVDSAAVAAELSPDGGGACSAVATYETEAAGAIRVPVGPTDAGVMLLQQPRRLGGVQAEAPIRPVTRARVSALTATIRSNPFEGDGSYFDLMPQVMHLVAKWDEVPEREVLGPIAMAARCSCPVSPAESMLSGGEPPVLGAIGDTPMTVVTKLFGMPEPDAAVDICTTPIAAAVGGCGAVRSMMTNLPLETAACSIASPMDCCPATPAEVAKNSSTDAETLMTKSGLLSASVGAVPYILKAAGMPAPLAASDFGGATITRTAATATGETAKPTSTQLRSRTIINRARRSHSREPSADSILESFSPLGGLGCSATVMQRELAAAFVAARPTGFQRRAGHAARRSFADLSDLASVAECDALGCVTPPEMKRRRGLLSRQGLLPSQPSHLLAGNTSSLAAEASLGSIQEHEPTLITHTVPTPVVGRRMQRSSSGTGLAIESPVRHIGAWRHFHEASQPQPIAARSRCGGSAVVVKVRGLAASVSSDVQNSSASDTYLYEMI